MCDKNSDENCGKMQSNDCQKSESIGDEEEDEDIDDSDESEEECLTETEDNGEESEAEEEATEGQEDVDSGSGDETEVDEESDEENHALNGGNSPRDGSDPQCYICLNRFSGQDIGSPQSCADLHHFCLECIEEWSKQINTCPVDRKVFTYIVVRREIGSSVIMKLPIVKNVVPDMESVPEDVTYCEICGRCDREDRLLLCDGCDFGYHCECLSPPLDTIPIEEWFCPDCYHRLFGPDTSTAIRTGGAGPSSIQRRRAIARTGASEAVRQRILQRRTEPVRRPVVRRKTTKRRRKTSKRRVTTKKRKTTSGKKTKRRTKRRTKKRRKKRTRKSAFASRRLPPPPDPRTRIASKLGIGPPPKSPFGLPSMKNVSNESVRRLIDSRAAAGISNLSLFGTELDVYDPRVQSFGDEDDLISQTDGTVGLMARSRVGAPLFCSPVKRRTDIMNSLANSELSPTDSSTTDLLTQIMSSQTLLHTSSRDVRIARDGSLHLNRDNSGLRTRSCGNSGQSSPALSPTHSSPARSPPTSSPQRTDSSSGAQSSSFNYSFGSASNRANNDSNYDLSEDISAVKPVLSPQEESKPTDESKVELYSDIESVGDNTRDNNSDTDGDEDKDDKSSKHMVITADDHSLDNVNNDKPIDAIGPQNSESSDPQMECPKTDTSVDNNCVQSSDNKLLDNNSNKSDERPQLLRKPIEKVVQNSPQKAIKSRKPSIKDLFGDSSDEEEDDSDIRRLLAEQGSINVHYPIKMSIVLKNSITRKEMIVSNSEKESTSEQKSVANQSTLHFISSTPAPDLSKWVAVHPKDSTPVPDSTTTHTSVSNKWKSIESSDDNQMTATSIESTNVETVDSNDKWKPITTSDVPQTTSAPQVDQLESGVNELTTTETNVCESESQSGEQLTISTELLSTTGADEEEGEIKDDDQKVRRCRHGRIRREHKNKEQRVDTSKSCRHRSRSSERHLKPKPKDKELGNKLIDCDVNCSDVNVVSDSSLQENVEFKEKTFEQIEKESEEQENSESVGWKKLSNSSKMRSYRDGKPKDEEILFRERELQKKLVKKSLQIKNKSKDADKEPTDRHSGHDSRPQKPGDSRRQHFPSEDNSFPSEDVKRKHRSELADKSEDVRKYKRKPEDMSSKHKRRVDDTAGHSSTVRKSPTVDEYSAQESKERHRRHHKSNRHKHRDSTGHKECSERQFSGGDRSHRSHRSSKHSHHSNKNKTGADSDIWSSGTPQKILRDHSSYSDITPLDSKEIYAEGDRIVINVNFNREKSKKPLESTTNEESNYANKPLSDESLDTRKTDSKTRVSTKKDDSIFWASPPPANTSTAGAAAANTAQTTNQMTTTITRIEDDRSSNHSNRSSNSERKLSEKSDTEPKKDSKVLEELRFLPRSLHQSDVRPLDRTIDPIERPLGPHTPEGDYCEDQFMPTPTQDESQSPVRSPSISVSSRSSPLSIRSSPMATNGSKDEVYDPEAPLQSPDSHQNKNSSRRAEPKSPDVIPNRQPSKRSPKPLARRQTSSSSQESKNRYSDGQRDTTPKSAPMASTTHSSSVRSPFKSTPIPIQRQVIKQSKPSPQKSSQTQHKSSSSLMPPPSTPTNRTTPASSFAVTAATIASINPQNLAQLLQMAHALNAKRQASAQVAHTQHRQPSNTNSTQNNSNNRDHSKDHNEVVDMDVESPSPPGTQQPVLTSAAPQQPRVTSTTGPTTTAQVKTLWEQIIKTTQQPKPGVSGQKRVNTSSNANSGAPLKKGRPDPSAVQKDRHTVHPHRHQVISVASDSKKPLTTSGNKLDQLTVLDDVPSSAVEMAVKEKFIKKLNRQERVIEEVKMVLKPYYQKRTVTKEEYKEILRKSVPKICHSRSGEINPLKIKSLIDGYIKRFKYLRKKSVKLPKK